MASSNFTARLGLSNWSGDDSPKRADFVSDNNIIDEKLGTHLSNTSIHMTSAEKTKALNPSETLVYAGTGEESRTISGATSQPKFAVVYKKHVPMAELKDGVLTVNFAFGSYSGGSTPGLSVTSTGIIVKKETADGVTVDLNEEGAQYAAVIVK